MATSQTWKIKKRWLSKFEEILRTSTHLAVGLIRRDCVYVLFVTTVYYWNSPEQLFILGLLSPAMLIQLPIWGTRVIVTYKAQWF